VAVAYDTPIVGWRGKRVNTLRLWRRAPIDPIRLDAFNRGDHIGALPTATRPRHHPVLYPADETPAGQELRLRQEYFFTSASLQDIVRRHLQQYGDLSLAARQGGDPAQRHASGHRGRRADAHPGRRARHPWDEAWEITAGTISYTNHTLLPEALESWPVPLMERLLPRHMQIIYRSTPRCTSRPQKRPLRATSEMLASVSLIDEGHGRRVRMGSSPSSARIRSTASRRCTPT
jgi:glycogen phosphorylase